MGNQLWLDSVRGRLAQYDLPPSYVQRFVAELGDHLEDIESESPEVDAASRLGDPAEVAAAAVAAYRRRRFFGRHPVSAFLVFALSPVVSLIVLVFVASFLWALICQMMAGIGASSNGAGGYITVPTTGWLSGLAALTCAALAVVLYGELAMWQGISKRWLFVSCPLIIAVAMLWQGSATGSGGLLIAMLLAQLLVPLVVGWHVVRKRREPSYPATTFCVFAVLPFVLPTVLICVFSLALYLATVAGVPAGLCGFAAMVEGPLVAAGMVQGVTAFGYCKLAGRLGLSPKWMLVSCVSLVLAAVPSICLYYLHGADPMNVFFGLCQIVVPLAVGGWFMRRADNGNARQTAPTAVRLLTFVLSPIAFYVLSWFIVASVVGFVLPLLSAPAESLGVHFGNAALMAWSFVPLFLMYDVPTIVASFLCCKLAKRLGSGRRWIFVSCVVLAAFASAQSYSMLHRCYQDDFRYLWVGMTASIIPAQFLVPLAVGGWFMRRRREPSRLQLAS
jgi:hypothetical protein